MDFGYMGALAAGALSFLSPCVLPLVPPYLCYMAGISVDDFRQTGVDVADRSRHTLILSSLAFVAGFSTVFVALGASAFAIGRLLRLWQEPLSIIAGIIIILMGLNFLGLIRIPFLSREARFQAQGKPASLLAAYVMGLAFAFGWTPCIGPVLGSILTVAGARETAGEGAALLAVYSAGLGIPFILAAMFSGAFMRFLAKFRVHLGKIEKIMGALLVAAGVLFITGGMQTMSFWLLETFPVFQQIG